MSDSTLKDKNKLLLHKLKCLELSRAILIGEITTHKFTKILFCYCRFHDGGNLQTIKCTIKSTKKTYLI